MPTVMRMKEKTLDSYDAPKLLTASGRCNVFLKGLAQNATCGRLDSHPVMVLCRSES